jgi:hypothetical protein
MSQASASSSTLLRLVSNGVEIPLRAKVTSGPVPGGPGRRVGCAMDLPGQARVDRWECSEELSVNAGYVDADGYEGVLHVGYE